MRSRALLFVLLILTVATAAFGDGRRRAVRSPGMDCTYSLVVAIPDPVPDSGLERAAVQVSSLQGNCTSWGAYSEVDWVQLSREGAAVYATFQPNLGPEPRTTTLRVAGLPVTVTQLGRTVLAEPNLLLNTTFDTSLASWGWQDRFPNGTGDATWSNVDANGSIASGSMRLRDDMNSSNAFQRGQCVAAEPGTYEFGAAVRANSRDAVRAVFAFVEFDDTNCQGSYPPYSARQVRVTEAGVWQRQAYTATISPNGRSFMLILASWAREEGLQEVWFDDVFVRPATTAPLVTPE